MPRYRAPDAPAFVVALAPDAGTLQTDAALVKRVLFHVIGNAFKFTERGEIRVETRRAPRGGCVIRVIDTGIGIAPAQLGRIFEVFRQGDDSHTRRHDGVGLDLSLVRACLGLLRGECRITPGTSGGTVVELVIPDLVGAAHVPAAASDGAALRRARA